MEELFITLQQRIANALPQLQTIDEDYGQLQSLLNGGDAYPIVFPCVLIGNMDVDWDNITPVTQQGDASITFRIAFDCYDDTHYGSGTEDKIKERLQGKNTLYRTLQSFRLNKEMGRLKRKKSTDYSVPGGIKVYEMIFVFDLIDDSAAQPL